MTDEQTAAKQLSPLELKQEKLNSIRIQLAIFPEAEKELDQLVREANHALSIARSAVLINGTAISRRALEKAKQASQAAENKFKEHQANLSALHTARDHVQEDISSIRRDTEADNTAKIKAYVIPLWDSALDDVQHALARAATISGLRGGMGMMAVDPLGIIRECTSGDEHRERWRETFEKTWHKISDEAGLE